MRDGGEVQWVSMAVRVTVRGQQFSCGEEN